MTGTSYTKVYRTSKTETKEESVLVKCNVCAEIIFNADGTGTVNAGDASSFLEVFTWKLSGNKILLTNSGTGKNNPITTGAYTLLPSTKILTLSEITMVNAENIKHILAKTN